MQIPSCPSGQFCDINKAELLPGLNFLLLSYQIMRDITSFTPVDTQMAQVALLYCVLERPIHCVSTLSEEIPPF